MKKKLSKYRFLLFLLQLFHKESFGTKVYLYFRILIFPGAFLRILPSLLGIHDRILDLWCGYGIVSLYLEFCWLHNQIFGLDIDKKRIHDLQTIAKDALFEHLHFQIRDFITEWFDGLHWYDTAILVDFLHHLDRETQNHFLTYLSQHVATLIIKDIDTKPRYKYYWNRFHDRILMQNKILCFQWSHTFQKLLTDLWYTVSYQKIPSIFPYPHYLLVAKK